MQVFSNRMQRGAALIFMIALLQVAGCQSKPLGVSPRGTIDSTVHQALAALPAGADAHLQAAAISTWLSDNLQKLRHHPAPDSLSVLASRTADPISSAFLFTAMLRHLKIEARTHMFTGVPGYGWYPLVEILDADGDHLWDPFTGRYAPDYDGTPLGLSEALASANILGPTGAPYQADPAKPLAPSFAELALLDRFVWNSRIASRLVAKVDLGAYAYREIALAGLGSEGEYGPGFTTAGITGNELGPLILMHSYALSGLAPGKTYTLRLSLSTGNPSNLLIMADGATLQARSVAGDDTTLAFAAGTTAATVNIGALLPSTVSFSAIRWSNP